MDELSILEKLFRDELLKVPKFVDCVDDRAFNSIAPATMAYPYAVFTVVPLDDKTGQARTSIQTRALIDLKFVTPSPLPDSVKEAVAAVKEHFRSSLTYDSQGFRISIRHERPISFTERGASDDDIVLNRGWRFRAYISRSAMDFYLYEDETPERTYEDLNNK